MRVVDAVWELRNMGVTSHEVTLDENDQSETVAAFLSGMDSEYIVVRAPAMRLDLYGAISSLGFMFVETMVHLFRGMELPIMSEAKRLLNRRMELRIADDDDINYIFRRIREGIYYTDRVYLDPCFTKQQAAQRYVGMLADAAGRPHTFIHKLTLDGACIGFQGIRSLENGEYDIFINGLFPEFTGKGYAFAFTSKLVELLAAQGISGIHSHVSTNNLPSMRVHLRYGYEVTGFNYVFIKHGKESHG